MDKIESNFEIIEIFIDKKERRNTKKDIGHNIIKLNKELEREYVAWCIIYNDYKDKLVLANSHYNQYKLLIEEIKRIINQMKKVITYYNRYLKKTTNFSLIMNLAKNFVKLFIS